jgi:hypothetical protein
MNLYAGFFVWTVMMLYLPHVQTRTIAVNSAVVLYLYSRYLPTSYVEYDMDGESCIAQRNTTEIDLKSRDWT